MGSKQTPSTDSALKHLKQKGDCGQGLAQPHSLPDDPHWVRTARNNVEVAKNETTTPTEASQ